ncbi:hypothetical protein AB0M46_38980 [Dactylosporangium sp. NPDC051485]|uniref:hypothetical protein n=1 Tax=Dactylosporangium sp. NPDC051485 TaxID=3154846 RepID=UPI00343068A5
MRRLVVPLVMVLSLGGCGWLDRHDETSKPDGILLHGYVSVAGAAAGATGSACQAPPTVPDIAQGATVRAADDAGHVIAAGELSGGVLAQAATGGYSCNFAFEFRNLSGSRATYTIMVGDRPATTFQTKAMREGTPAIIEVAGPTASSSPS